MKIFRRQHQTGTQETILVRCILVVVTAVVVITGCDNEST
jgi:hypothetical protein